MSLTTVFGMGTGVPSSQLTPTVFFFRKTFVIITPLRYYVKKKIGDPWENRTPVYGVRGRRLDRLTNGPRKKKRAGTYLFSRVVSNQVSSAQQSLTTVFGMGTGGTSASSAPAMNMLMQKQLA